MQKATVGRKRGIARMTVLRLLPALLGLLCLLLLLLHPDRARASVERGIRLCLHTLIPSIFPFTVLSGLLIGGGLSDAVAHLLRKTPLRPTSLVARGGYFLPIAALCGFPVGASAILALWRQGRIDTDEAERLLLPTTAPSLAFLTGTVGEALLHRKETGLFLFFATQGTALLLSLIPTNRKKRHASLSPPPLCVSPSVGSLLTDSVTSAATSMLSVSAFVVFFSVLIGCLEPSLSLLPAPLSAVAAALLELTGGVLHAAPLREPISSALCGFAVGWSGLSIHLQTLSLCGEIPFSRPRFFFKKLLQGFLTALAALLFARR